MQADQDNLATGYQYPPEPKPVDKADQDSLSDNRDTEDEDHIEETGQTSYAYPPLPTPVPYQDAVTDAVNAIVKQPSGQDSRNTPPGLELMHDMTQVFLKQEVEIFDAIFGCNTKNKYKVKNSQGKIVYVLKEETNCCTRNCCGSLGAFDLSIVDSEEREVIQLSRPPTCNTCPCWLQVLEVQSPPGTRVGSVVQEWNMCHPQFRVMDATGEIKFRIKGSGCPLFMCGSVEFQILDGSNVVGKVSKKWSGLLREGFTEADNFGLSFPPEVDVRMKAVLLGALFLLHRMYFDE